MSKFGVVLAVLIVAGLFLASEYGLREQDPVLATVPEDLTTPPTPEESVKIVDDQSDQITRQIEPQVAKRVPGWAWYQANPTSELPLAPIRSDIELATLIEVNRDQLEKLSAGDQIDIFLPGTSTATVWIEHVQVLASGNLSLRGHIDGNRLYGFVMTLGKQSTFASFGTPQGVFDLRGNAKHAWLVPAKVLNQHVNPNTPDYRVSQARPEPTLEEKP